jgi:hypothetical protein
MRFDSPCVAPTRTLAPAHGSELMFALELRRALWFMALEAARMRRPGKTRTESNVSWLIAHRTRRLSPGSL